ncbi:MAG: hypothetical protein CML50_08600 [Rhodobacteraceae bacterium]|jgi:flagellar motility protein MotE (MotC chaperone)|uniref:MotE family protein n=1 Tax=Salipiger TaxID=263377 RepID=UPI00030E58C4|nr:MULTISPECIES: hypothetical protein [Salipiger]MAB06062.1 hypothetical protein [Paracoccaceae bacterium]GGA11500.1 hypothetical protein GCM10011326_24310 [Salipiger profundus]SFC70145.1 Flagellar motility protein MotE, a chaperone for MotC folding [Salipiger profundus]
MRSLFRKPPAPSRRPKRRGRSVLAVIGALMISSAVARVAVQAGAALAVEPDTPPAPVPVVAEAEHSPADTSALPTCATEEDIAPILDALRGREERVAKRESALQKRLQALSIAEQEIERRMTAMQETEEKLRATLAMAETAAEDDVSRLTQVYATMKPKQAAALFQEMDAEFAAGFLGRMRPDAAAAIMAGLDPQTAYTISVMLAGRNAAAPKQ